MEDDMVCNRQHKSLPVSSDPKLRTTQVKKLRFSLFLNKYLFKFIFIFTK